MPVQSMNQGLDAGLVDVSNVGCCLARLLTGEDCVRVDESESIDDDLSFD